jgi:heterotetrameric sarcosine oxidase delta subunit
VSLLLPCPHCGERPLEEFLYGEIPRVPDAIEDADARDVDRAFMHDNREGPVEERWFHAAGCRRWLTLWRDTSRDALVPPPAGAGEGDVE